MDFPIVSLVGSVANNPSFEVMVAENATKWTPKPYSSQPDVVYNTYSGTDIVAQVVLPSEGAITLGELQTISYSIHRENVPVRILGHVNPVGFVKGPRTIAGSLIFTVFNFYAFYRIKQFKTAVNSGLYPLADMLPPFDIVLTFANESGSFSKMKIYGVTIVDEGGTMSVDDLIVEQTYSFMARGIQPMTPFIVPSPTAIEAGRQPTFGLQ
ncbi:MAG TPA: hypothetical protein VJ742_12225 [Nitrososphaera sp.]|nr:hypothetical protein [Nitrososphaera sp.]